MASSRPILRITPQRQLNDCGIAALAMLLDLRYEPVLHAAEQAIGGIPLEGLRECELRKIARTLGYPLRAVVPANNRSCSGRAVMGIRSYVGDDHWTVVVDGRVYDTDGCVWELTDYLEFQNAWADLLLYRRDQIPGRRP